MQASFFNWLIIASTSHRYKATPCAHPFTHAAYIHVCNLASSFTFRRFHCKWALNGRGASDGWGRDQHGRHPVFGDNGAHQLLLMLPRGHLFHRRVSNHVTVVVVASEVGTLADPCPVAAVAKSPSLRAHLWTTDTGGGISGRIVLFC